MELTDIASVFEDTTFTTHERFVLSEQHLDEEADILYMMDTTGMYDTSEEIYYITGDVQSKNQPPESYELVHRESTRYDRFGDNPWADIPDNKFTAPRFDIRNAIDIIGDNNFTRSDNSFIHRVTDTEKLRRIGEECFNLNIPTGQEDEFDAHAKHVDIKLTVTDTIDEALIKFQQRAGEERVLNIVYNCEFTEWGTPIQDIPEPSFDIDNSEVVEVEE